MSEYLLQLVGKWISLVVVSTASFFQVDLYNKNVVDIKNNNYLKDYMIKAIFIKETTKDYIVPLVNHSLQNHN